MDWYGGFPRDSELHSQGDVSVCLEVIRRAMPPLRNCCMKSLHGGYFTGLWFVARALQRLGSWVGIPGSQCHHVIEYGEGLPTN